MAIRKTVPPRGVLKRAAVDPRPYVHARYQPPADLAPFVEHYWSVRWDLRGQPPQRVETLPHPSVHLVFERGGKSRVGGVARGKFSRLLRGEGGVFAVKFTPGGFYAVASVPVASFTDRTFRLREVFGPAGAALDRAVLAAPDDAARITVIETFLRARQPVRDAMAERMADIVYAVARDRDILKVEHLVERHGLSKRMLQRLFAKYVGVSPKWVIQRYRLHEAAEQLACGPVKQATLAAQLGYSDQAHFVRDFKAIVGTSPAAYAREAVPRD